MADLSATPLLGQQNVDARSSRSDRPRSHRRRATRSGELCDRCVGRSDPLRLRLGNTLEGMRAYQSWGRYPHVKHTRVVPVSWRSAPPELATIPGYVLPYACGRSYGDSCLNDGGTLLDVTGLNRFIAFDEARSLLRCEAGVTLAEILALVVPKGWFVPVVPGTRWVSVGGAIANDIHGKNHHRAGTFGSHVACLELLRSSGERVLCSPDSNAELFRATIGGL